MQMLLEESLELSKRQQSRHREGAIGQTSLESGGAAPLGCLLAYSSACSAQSLQPDRKPPGQVCPQTMHQAQRLDII